MAEADEANTVYSSSCTSGFLLYVLDHREPVKLRFGSMVRVEVILDSDKGKPWKEVGQVSPLAATMFSSLEDLDCDGVDAKALHDISVFTSRDLRDLGARRKKDLGLSFAKEKGEIEGCAEGSSDGMEEGKGQGLTADQSSGMEHVSESSELASWDSEIPETRSSRTRRRKHRSADQSSQGDEKFKTEEMLDTVQSEAKESFDSSSAIKKRRKGRAVSEKIGENSLQKSSASKQFLKVNLDQKKGKRKVNKSDKVVTDSAKKGTKFSLRSGERKIQREEGGDGQAQREEGGSGQAQREEDGSGQDCCDAISGEAEHKGRSGDESMSARRPTTKRPRKLLAAKTVRCQYCEVEFENQKAYFDHRKAEEFAYRCKTCGKVEPYRAFLIVHMQKHNPVLVDGNSDIEGSDESKHGESSEPNRTGTTCASNATLGKGESLNEEKNKKKKIDLNKKKKQRMKCDICGVIVSSVDSLKIHTMLHTGETAYRCCVCGETFYCLSSRQHHMASHVTALKFRCTPCDLRFESRAELAKHQLNHEIQCALCGEVFPNRTSRNCHYRVAHPETILKCDQCSSHFASPDELSRHLAYHRKDKREQCPICGVVVCKLKDHMIVHNKEGQDRIYACDKCPMRYLRRINLERHLLVHSGEKPYACNNCPKRFRSNGMLRRHLLTHTEEKPFQCEVCGKRCALRSNLNTHMRIHSSSKKYSCDVCLHTFNHRSSLVAHIKAKHSEPAHGKDSVLLSSSRSFVETTSDIIIEDSLPSDDMLLAMDPQTRPPNHPTHNPAQLPLSPPLQAPPLPPPLLPPPSTAMTATSLYSTLGSHMHATSSGNYTSELRKAINTPISSGYSVNLASRSSVQTLSEQPRSSAGIVLSSYANLAVMNLPDKVEAPDISESYLSGMMDKSDEGEGVIGGSSVGLSGREFGDMQQAAQLSLQSSLASGMLLDTDKIFMTKFDMNTHSDSGY